MSKEIVTTSEASAPILWPIQDAFKRAKELSQRDPTERFTARWSFGRWNTQFLKIEAMAGDYDETNLTVCRVVPFSESVDVDYDAVDGTKQKVEDVANFIFRYSEELDYPQTITVGNLGRTVMLMSTGKHIEREVVRPLDFREVSELGGQIITGQMIPVTDQEPLPILRSVSNS